MHSESDYSNWNCQTRQPPTKLLSRGGQRSHLFHSISRRLKWQIGQTSATPTSPVGEGKEPVTESARKPKVALIRLPVPFVPRDERVPEGLWDLPLRIQRANDAGPRCNQTELAELAGLAQSVISKVMNRNNLYGIRLETLYKLAGALNVSVLWLLGESRARKARPRKSKSKRKARRT